jgi:uncharacterized RDD family membrane protein YckC
MGLKYCPRCGGQLEENADFCNYCGEDLKERKLMQKNQPSITPQISQKSVISTPISQEIPIVEKKEMTRAEYASFLPRFAACLIDVIILGSACFFFLLFLYPIGPIVLIGVPLIIFFYFWLLEILNKGQTVGKIALKLRTVDAKTLEPSKPVYYLVNNLLKCVPFLFLLDLIIGLLVNIKDTKKRRRIMQNASKTVVIKIRK